MGGGTRHVELGRELVARGWRVMVAASDFHIHERRYQRRSSAADRAIHRETADGVEVAWLWAAPYVRNDLRRVWNWLSFARSLQQMDLKQFQPDVVIGSSPHLFAALSAFLVARRLGVPFVLEVRDLWPESLAVSGNRKGPGYLAFWLLARLLYRLATRIIVLAEGVGSYLVEHGVPAGKIVFVPNGVDAKAFSGAARAPRDTLRLVYAGAHGPANGLETVLHAAALLRDEPRVSFVLVGDGPAKKALVEEAARLRLDNLVLQDSVSKAQMPAMLSSCDAGLMVLKDVPVFAFGVSPNKLFDYWGASLPVVCNVRGEVASLVARAAGGVQAEDASARALANAVRKMLTLSPAERAAMGERGRVWVTRERDRPVVAERLHHALRPLVSVAS